MDILSLYSICSDNCYSISTLDRLLFWVKVIDDCWEILYHYMEILLLKVSMGPSSLALLQLYYYLYLHFLLKKLLVWLFSWYNLHVSFIGSFFVVGIVVLFVSIFYVSSKFIAFLEWIGFFIGTISFFSKGL